jgi:hypothetical protein
MARIASSKRYALRCRKVQIDGGHSRDSDHVGAIGRELATPFRLQPPGVVLADDREVGFLVEGDMSHQIIVLPIRVMAIPLVAGARASPR